MVNPVVWSVDPFQTEIKPSISVIRELERWADKTNSSIQPVYVLTVPDQEALIEAGGFLQYSRAAREATLQYIHDLGIENVLPPRILVDQSSSVRHSCEKLIEFAEDFEAKMILVTSRGRTGLGRLVYGSFGESLVAKSHLPVLFLTHPETHKDKNFDRILFPTDFSEVSKKTFEVFLRQVRTLDPTIILFHEVCLPMPMVPGLGGLPGGPWIPDNYFREKLKWAMHEGAQWRQKALSLGVNCTFRVSETNPDVSGSILNEAQRAGVGLIAMASHSGPFEAAFTGSVAQEVYRSNAYPVWVCGPKVFEDSMDNFMQDSPVGYLGFMTQ